MFNCRIWPAGHTAAMPMVCRLLKQRGFTIQQQPGADTTHLLLPVPAFGPDGNIRGGGDLAELLEQLSPNVTVIGGNLQHPLLLSYDKLDLLDDPFFVAKNAAITAHCAVRMITHALPCTLERCPVLVIGWGRIGKILSRLLDQMGAKVVVAARKATDRAMLEALGYGAVDTYELDPTGYRVIVNTVPVPILTDCSTDALKIDLASVPGITGTGVIWARGLPGKDAPESAAQLIAHTITKHLSDKEVLL